MGVRRHGGGALLVVLTLVCGLLAGATGHAQPAVPSAIKCLGVAPGWYVVRWIDEADDESEYRIERSGDDGANWEEVGDVAADAEDGDEEYFVDDEADPDGRSLYRVRAYREDDDSFSAYSAECGSPDWLERDNFRVFYNTDDCSAANCVPAGADPDGDNEYAARIATVLEGALADYHDFGFRDPEAVDGMAGLWPANLKVCDGRGCWSRFGIGLTPAYMDPYDHVANTGQPRSVATTLHELFHGVQHAYEAVRADPSRTWVSEGQARGIEDLLCVQFPLDPCVNVDDETTSFYSEARGYLGDPSRTLTELSYGAALFWNYLCQEYGDNETEPERGLDFLAAFWDEAATDADRDGIQVIDATLEGLGSADRFTDAFENFLVANYVKDLGGAGVPARYRYVDETQAPGSYGSVSLAVDRALAAGDQVGPELSGLPRWSAAYFRVQPQAGLDAVEVNFRVDSPDPAFFALLAVKDDDLALEERATGLELIRNLPNDAYDAVVVIAGALEHHVNFRYSFNGQRPVLRVLSPRGADGQRAFAGSAGSPEKFLARLEILEEDGDPVRGAAAGEFTFTVGAAPVPAEDVVTSAYVQGQYWFVLGAPQQAADGRYDLAARWGDLEDSEVGAVEYAARADADTVLVIDRSGSMEHPATKITDAKAAATLYVDSFREGDGVGMVSFNCTVSDPIDLTLAPWEDNRDAALAAVGAIEAGGDTSIGAALEAAYGELEARADPDHALALVLLSDGLNTCGDDLDDYLSAHGDESPPVHVVAIGPDANRPDLERLAAETEGSYHFAAEPAGGGGGGLEPETNDLRRELAELYRVVSERLTRQSQVLAVRGSVAAGRSAVHGVEVDAAAHLLVVATVWRRGALPTRLRDPAGSAAYPPFRETATHRVYRVSSPLAGRWELEVVGGSQFPSYDYLAEAAVGSLLTFDLYLALPVAERVTGTPMPILAALTDIKPVPAAVAAEVQVPAGARFVLPLADDGRHGDGGAGDGIYGNLFRPTGQAGNYRVLARAAGATAALGRFVRQARESFTMRADTNGDQDCLPDGYEARFGLDPARSDTPLDTDGDGLGNCTEFELGTSPVDPDTDDDGESDGSEVARGRNPLERDAATVKPLRACGYPGVGRMALRHDWPRGVVAYDVFRAGETGGFQLIAQGFPVRAPFVFLDQGLANDRPYRYRLVSIGPQGERSAPSDTVLVTPRSDPNPPHGVVVIDGGAPVTATRQVTLSLWASDVYDPEDDAQETHDPTSETSGVQAMRIGNQSDLSTAAWEPYATERSWTLEPGAAQVAVVFVQYRDRTGNVSAIVHDAIRVEKEGPRFGFRRGDADLDGAHNITDGVLVLRYLFTGVPARLRCRDSADTNDDGVLNLTDPVRLLTYLFRGGDAPLEPFSRCGLDTTGDALTCDSPGECPR